MRTILEPFDDTGRPRLVYGPGCLSRLGTLASELGFRRTLLVADPRIRRSAHFERALKSLGTAGIEAVAFSDFDHDPDETMAACGQQLAHDERVDSIVGLGGGSSLDCAKAINFLTTNGGRMQDYWGYDKAADPLLPMIGIPTTTGTGSEAQSYALISDSKTHVKMACGAASALVSVALLDPELTLSQPNSVTAISGYDAISHAVESFVTKTRTAVSTMYAREAFRLLSTHFTDTLADGDDLEARAGMQLGAFFAGRAIEQSMLGATHACANPLSQRYGTTHGRAIALCLPQVVRFNSGVVFESYQQLAAAAGLDEHSPEALADWLRDIAIDAGLKTRLRDCAVSRTDLPALADRAAEQWTGLHNPRAFGKDEALEIYEAAF